MLRSHHALNPVSPVLGFAEPSALRGESLSPTSQYGTARRVEFLMSAQSLQRLPSPQAARSSGTFTMNTPVAEASWMNGPGTHTPATTLPFSRRKTLVHLPSQS
jgi:hypothetical protein